MYDFEARIIDMFCKKGMEYVWGLGLEHAWDVVRALNMRLEGGWKAVGPNDEDQKTWIWFSHPDVEGDEKLHWLPEETKVQVMKWIEELERDGIPRTDADWDAWGGDEYYGDYVEFEEGRWCCVSDWY